MNFYISTLRKLIASGSIQHADRILVVCGGPYDASCLKGADLENAIISNLDQNYAGYCAPFEWRYLDAEELDLPDNSFDWVIEHAGLHHCASPHRALLEMYRVARKGVVAIEARDSALMRLAVKLGLTPSYELEAVALHANGLGGLRNTGVPNFIYRWREEEVLKTIESARPDKVNEVEFFYGLSLPTERLSMVSPWTRIAAYCAGGAAKAITLAAPSQGNQFGFAVHKRDQLKPWVQSGVNGSEINPRYALSFDPAKYVREPL